MSDIVRTSIRISSTSRKGSDDSRRTSGVKISNRSNSPYHDSFDFDIDVTTYDGDGNVLQQEGSNQRNVTSSTTLNFSMAKPDDENFIRERDIDRNCNEIRRYESPSPAGRKGKAIPPRSRNSSSSELMEKKEVDMPIRISSSVDNLLYENGQFYNKLAECDREYITRSEQTIAKPPYKPKKPKRSMKYDRNRCTFVPWESTGSSFESISEIHTAQYQMPMKNYVIPEEELDDFIRREKVHFSGEVLQNSTEFLYDTQKIENYGLPSFRDFELVCNNMASRDDDNNSLLSSVFSDSRKMSSDTTISISTLVTVNTTDHDFDQIDSNVDSSNISVPSRKASIDSSIHRQNIINNNISPISRTEITRRSTPLNHHVRTELPAPPEDKTKLAKIRDKLKNVGRRFSNPNAAANPSIPKRTSSLKPAKSKEKIVDEKIISRSKDVLNDGGCNTPKKDKTSDNGQISRNGELHKGRVNPDARTSKDLALECERQEKYLQVERARIEEERLRLMKLKQEATERSALEHIERTRQEEKRKVEENEIEVKKVELSQLEKEHVLKAETERKLLQDEMEKMKAREDLLKQRENELVELQKERARREELERLLETERMLQNMLDQSLNDEKEKLHALEKNLAEERTKRLEIEKKLMVEESRNRLNENDIAEDVSSETRSIGTVIPTNNNNNNVFRKRTSPFNVSLRSAQSAGTNIDDINLLHHITALGHDVEHSPEIKINKSSCSGYLQKMGKSRLKISWKRRWFVFDRKLRALCYYPDERKTRSDGILYFQSIQEVYVDSSIRRSPSSNTTFCVRTPTRLYVLAAPTAIAMSIWIDVMCTGKEGAFISSVI